jgi:general secretion pathway protein F
MRYEVRALKAHEGIVSIAIDATDEASAIEQARVQGLAVLSARPRRAWPTLARSLDRGFPLVLFSQELVALLDAGLSLPETLETMVEKEGRSETRAVLTQVRDKLFEGRSFSQALEAFPQVFPALYVATVRASERTGDLPEALRRFIAYQERIEFVRKRVVSASIYPFVLLAVGGLVTLFLLGYVVPKFSGIYADSGRDLPWMSRLLLEWGNLINQHGLALAIGLIVGIVLCVVFRRELFAVLMRGLTRIPAVGARLLVYHLARTYRTLGMLLRGGIPIVSALSMVGGLLPLEIRDRLNGATRRIREGISISSAMSEAGLTTPVASRMLRVGEKSGDMASMMERIAVFHDEELARWVDWFTKLFEPVLMVFIGVVIGAIVVLLYLPIFELAGSLQ